MRCIISSKEDAERAVCVCVWLYCVSVSTRANFAKLLETKCNTKHYLAQVQHTVCACATLRSGMINIDINQV